MGFSGSKIVKPRKLSELSVSEQRIVNAWSPVKRKGLLRYAELTGRFDGMVNKQNKEAFEQLRTDFIRFQEETEDWYEGVLAKCASLNYELSWSFKVDGPAQADGVKVSLEPGTAALAYIKLIQTKITSIVVASPPRRSSRAAGLRSSLVAVPRRSRVGAAWGDPSSASDSGVPVRLFSRTSGRNSRAGRRGRLPSFVDGESDSDSGAPVALKGERKHLAPAGTTESAVEGSTVASTLAASQLTPPRRESKRVRSAFDALPSGSESESDGGEVVILKVVSSGLSLYQQSRAQSARDDNRRNSIIDNLQNGRSAFDDLDDGNTTPGV